MLETEKALISMQEKLDALLESKQDTKSSVLDLVSQIKEVIHRISILERFDVKRIDKLETYSDILKDRLLVIESKGPPAMQQLMDTQKSFNDQFIDLKLKVENIHNHLEEKNRDWKNIVLTCIQIIGTILSVIILFRLGVK